MKVSLFIVPLALGALLAGAALAAGWPPPLAPQAAHRTPVHRTVSRRAKCPPVRHRAERHVAARHRVEHRRYAEARSQPSQRPCPRHHFVASSKSLRHHQEFAFHGVTSWPTQGREEWR
ncbi:MAG: hypothetical protein ACREEX_09745, partial [Caulobacteraceae bacterium]